MTSGQKGASAADAARGLKESIDRALAVVGAVPETGASQSSAAAIQGHINAARDAANASGVTQDHRDAIIRELQSKIERFESDERARSSRPVRRSGFSLAEGCEILADDIGLVRSETKTIFGRLGEQAARRSKAYRAKFGDRSPLDILIRGALVPSRAGVMGVPVPFVFGSEDEAVREVRALHDQIVVWSITKHGQSGRYPQAAEAPMFEDYAAACAVLSQSLLGKALDTTDTANLVPTSFSATLLERYDLERVLVKHLNVQRIPRSPFQMPVMGAYTTTYKMAEATVDPESASSVTTSDLTTSKTTYTLVSLAARTSWSYELEEDAIPAVAEAAVNQLALSMAYSEEQAILDGDTTATHQDFDVTSATDVRKAWKGFRKHAIANSYTTDLSAAFDADGLMGMIRSLGKYGVKHRDLVWCISPKTRAFLLTLKDKNNNPVMVGVASPGQPAAITTISDVQFLFGIPVATVESFREDLNDSGVDDGSNTTKTGILLINKGGWGYAWTNEQPTVESQRWIRTRQVEVVASMRRDFQPTYAIATNKTVWYGIKVPTS